MATPPIFTTSFQVRVSDLNYGAHLGNDRVLTLFHEARVRWLGSLGWTELDLGGVGLIQTEAQIRYRAQGHLGDNLTCELRLVDVLSRGFTLAYVLARPADGARIATGTTVLRFFDYTSQRIASAPSAFMERFAES